MRVVIIGFGLIKMVGLFYVTKVRRMGLVMIRCRTALLLRLPQMLGYEFYFAWREPLGCLLIALVE